MILRNRSKSGEMCGISCVVALDRCGDSIASSPKAPGNETELQNLEQQLEASLEIIKHRGPDSRGHYISADRKVGKFLPVVIL